MKTLALAPALSLPLDAVTQRLSFLGKPGSGKSYAATKLAEMFHDAGAQFVALDPVGIWYGLRVDGKGEGLPIPVFGGLHGDIPLEPTAGALFADLIVDRRLSCVLDVSQFEHDTDKARFAAGFAARFYFRMKAAPAAVHVFLEECQEFVPQNPQRGEERMLHDFTRMDKLGRNFGIGMSLITQRPQEVNKKVLNLTECLFAFQMTGAHERKAIKEWVTTVGADEEILTTLPGLAVAHAHVYSPQWLRISKVVKVGEKRTADVSSTPTVGASKAAGKPLTPVDLAELRSKLTATIEKAKADDPKELRREIGTLKKQLSEKPAPTADPQAVERAIASAVVAKDREIETIQRQHFHFVRDLAKKHARAEEAIREVALALSAEPVESKGPGVAPRQPRPDTPIARPDAPRQPTARPTPRAEAPTGLTPSMQRVLDALLALEELGITPAVRVNLAFFAGYTENGHFNNMLGSLRTMGLLDYPTGGTVALTDGGRSAANASSNPIKSLGDLHRTWLAKLSPSEGKILSVLIAEYPTAIPRADLAETTGYTENGHFNNMLGHLRTLGVAQYPTKGSVAATDVLFPQGLR